MPENSNGQVEPAGSLFRVRRAVPDDLEAIIEIDADATGSKKADYYKQYIGFVQQEARPYRIFLIAEVDGEPGGIKGFAAGEVRDWEFGSPRSGWITNIVVKPDARERGIGTLLLNKILDAFREAGANTVRTLPPRDNHTVVSFFRSQGLMAGPSVDLEMSLR